MAKNEWYEFYLRTGGILSPIPLDDFFIKEIIRRDNIREGKPEGSPLTDGRIRHWAYRFDEERNRWGQDFDSVMPLTISSPIEVHGGDWYGNFMYPYFSAAYLGMPNDFLLAHFDDHKRRGYRDILLNADQDNWMGRMGRPDWGTGFVWFENNNLDRVKWAANEMLKRGIRPHFGLFDQPRLNGITFDLQTDLMKEFLQEMKDLINTLMYSWEIDERWPKSDDENGREQRLIKLANIAYGIAPDVNFSLHMANGLHGGHGLYGDMPPTATRAMQYPREASDNALREDSQIVAPIAVEHDTKICVFEHSAPERHSNYSIEEAKHRSSICHEAMLQFLPAERTGVMNG